jgi:hypothetical protein
MGVIEKLVKVPEALNEVQFEELCKKPYAGQTEVQIDTGLSFFKLYAGVYENGVPTNRIININKPWEIKVAFGLSGPLKELICGKWCVDVNFESIGPGNEYRLTHPEIDFSCHDDYWCVTIPGAGVVPTDCGTPYKLVATVMYHSMCDKPAGIVGFYELPLIEFYAA